MMDDCGGGSIFIVVRTQKYLVWDVPNIDERLFTK